MKTLPVRLVLFLFGIAAIIVIPFLPGFRAEGDFFHLTYTIAAPAPGFAQVFWKSSETREFSEEASSRLFYRGGNKPIPIAHPLRPGEYHRLRLDFADHPVPVRVTDLRIVDAGGATVMNLDLKNFEPVEGIDRLEAIKDGYIVHFQKSTTDPRLELALDPPLKLKLRQGEWLIQWAQRTAIIGAILCAGILTWRTWPRLRRSIASAKDSLAQRPYTAIAWISLAATLLATYPVWLVGRSFVSPNNGGANLLYDIMPTVPGYDDSLVYPVHGSDVGAIMWQHIPYARIQREALLDGSLPYWNRYNSGGTTLLGQGQSMFGDPLMFIVSLTGSSSWAWDLRFLVSRWLYCFGIGACAWLISRRLGAALLVAFASAFVGLFTYRVNHPAIFSFTYAPCVLLSWILLAHAKDRRRLAVAMAGLVGSNFALMNSGTVKEAYSLLLLMNLAGVFLCGIVPPDWATKAKRLFAGALSLAVFMLLAAPIWFVFLRQLTRAYTSYNTPYAFQIQGGMLLGFFDELFYRPLVQGDLVFNPSTNFVILAGFAFLVVQGAQALAHRSALALSLAAGFGALLAFGAIPPSWVIQVPFLRNIGHIDNSFSCGLIILVSVLSSVGFAFAAERLKEEKGGRDLVMALLFVGALIAAWLSFSQAIHRPTYGHGVTYMPIWTGDEVKPSTFIKVSLLVQTGALALAGWLAWRCLQRSRWSIYAVVGLLLCLGTCLWRLGAHAKLIGFPAYTVQLGERVNFAKRSKAVEAMKATQAQEPSRVLGLNSNLFPGWTAYWGLETLSGPDALMNQYYRELQTAGPIKRIWDWRLYVTPREMAQLQPFLDFLNVRYIADFQSDQGLLGRTHRPVALVDLDVYESTGYWPRAFFTDRIVPYAKVEALVNRVQGAEGRWFAGVEQSDLEGGDSYSPLKTAPNEGPGRQVAAHDYQVRSNSTAFTIEAPGPGIAVLTEVFSKKEIRATINGTDAEVLRVNHAFRGLWLPKAGSYRIEMWYQPRGYWEGLTLFGFGVALALFIGLLFRRIPL